MVPGHIPHVNDSLNSKKNFKIMIFPPFQEQNPKYLNGDAEINIILLGVSQKIKKPIYGMITSFWPWKS